MQIDIVKFKDLQQITQEEGGKAAVLFITNLTPPNSEGILIAISEPEIPAEYADLAYVFLKEKADELLDYTTYDHKIDTRGKQLLFRPLYNLSQPKLATLKDYIDKNLAKGFI